MASRFGLHPLGTPVNPNYLPNGASWTRSFGVTLALLFVLESLTGFALATAYSPSTTDAWASVHHIVHHTTGGALTRALHHFGSAAMIVLALLGLIFGVVNRLHRPPREGVWLLYIVLFALILGFDLTGLLLPMDERGYWAIRVRQALIAGGPGGELLNPLVHGGLEVGNLTLTRFYAVHVVALPAAFIAVGGYLIALTRRVGPAPGRPNPTRTATYWPLQAAVDGLMCVVVLTILLGVSWYVGLSLEAPADPAGGYQARPEWYFLFVFQAIKYLEGGLVVLGTVGLPALCFGFLALMPWLDHRDAEAPISWRVRIIALVIVSGIAALVTAALSADAHDESYQLSRAEAQSNATLASTLAELGGIDAAGRITLYEGVRLYESKGCASCHRADSPDRNGPLLGGFGTLERTSRILKEPDHDDLFGKTVLAGEMEPFEGSEEERQTLSVWLHRVGDGEKGLVSPETNKQAAQLFEDNCTDCHNDPAWTERHGDYDLTASGPDLHDYLSRQWVRGLLINASHPKYYGGALADSALDEAMPPYDELTDDELSLLVTWLLAGAPYADTPIVR